MNQISKNINHIKSQIKGAKLIAVSKRQPVEKVMQALGTGHRLFGENKVQEAMEKWLPLRNKYSDIGLHLIGGLQTNKIKDALATFDVIETVDSEKLAKGIIKELDKLSNPKTKEFYIQINIGEEPQKRGVMPEDTDEFIKYCLSLGINITGLMCIPPFEEKPDEYFALMQKTAKRNDIPNLSMGMSGDYLTAVKYGATHIRVGTGIFGER